MVTFGGLHGDEGADGRFANPAKKLQIIQVSRNSRKGGRVMVERATLAPQILEHLNRSSLGGQREGRAIQTERAGWVFRSCPLQNFQVPSLRRILAGLFVPRATTRPGEPQDLDPVMFRSLGADELMPGELQSLSRPAQYS